MGQEQGVKRSEGLAAEAMARFLTIHRYLTRYSRHMMCDLGVSGRKLAALRFIQAQGRATVGDIAAHLAVRYSSASEMINKLEESGLAARTRGEEDSRVVWIELTDEGRELVETAPLGGLGLLRERLKGLEEEELAFLNEAFRRMAELIDLELPDVGS